MKVLIDTSDIQTVSILPRYYPTNINYKIVEEGNDREATGSNIATSTIDGFLTFSDKFQLNEDNFYSLYVYDASNGAIINRDKVFCTNQNATEYTINNGEYTQDQTYDSGYVIYGDDNTKPDTPTLISVNEE
jgi:hypothetical protein